MSLKRIILLTIGGMVVLVVAGTMRSTFADCPCKAGAAPMHGVMAPIPETGQFPMSTSMPMASEMIVDGRHMAHPYVGAGQASVPAIGAMGTFSPPPGNLGRVYRTPSALVPEDVHPRVGMVDIYGLKEDDEIITRGLKSVWMGHFWRLESENPLVPGVPHIFEIRVQRGEEEFGRRTIRLARGRIVDLKF